MQRQRGYDRDLGWTAPKVHALVKRLLNVLAKYHRADLVGFSCSIRLSGYRMFKSHNPTAKTYIEIGLDHCVGNMFRHKDVDLP